MIGARFFNEFGAGQWYVAGGSGRNRCRMHGGAPGSGAPLGNKYAVKHGQYTREAYEERRQLGELIRQSRELLQKMK